MTLQDKILLLRRRFFRSSYNCLFDVPLSILTVKRVYIVELDATVRFCIDVARFVLFLLFSLLLFPLYSPVLVSLSSYSRTRAQGGWEGLLLFRGITLFRLFPICRRQVAFYVVMEPADSIARMVTGSARWLSCQARKRVHIGRVNGQ